MAELIETMVLLVSEVVTNAILHSGSGAELRLILSGETVRAEVRDRSSTPPAVKQYSETATTGRGMLIVESLATAWGTEVEAKGKVVWFSVDAASSFGEPVVHDRSAATLTSPKAARKSESAPSAISAELEDDVHEGMVLAGAGW
jgi:histidine kinase-like protein